MTMNKAIFSGRLRQQRELNKLTQKELAAAINVTERGYQNYEAAENLAMPTAESLFSLAEKLNISVDYLLGRTTNPRVNT
jgi:transcriptional regulator with XRE-family HTH domain